MVTPYLNCRRIDLAIGERDLWGQGLGTEMVRLLTEFGFGCEGADIIFGCCVADYNIRSRKAFERNGYKVFREVSQEEGAEVAGDLCLTKEDHLASI